MKETQVEDVEVNDEAEAKKAWELGKQLELSIEDEDAVIKAISDVFYHEKRKPMKRRRKKCKGKERKD